MKYGSALPETFDFPKWAFTMKKDLTAPIFEDVVIRSGDTVMDCGAFIGMFSVAVLEQGAARVFAYEPIRKPLTVLMRNLEPYGARANIHASALTGRTEGHVLITTGTFPGCNSILETPKKKRMLVPALAFRDEFLRVQPDVIKFDMEGAEYQILETLRPGDLAGVNCVFVEFHPIEERERRVREARDYIIAEGFEVRKEKLREFTAVRAISREEGQ